MASGFMEPYPLKGTWARLREDIERAPIPRPTGVTRETCLDAAERIVRALATWQDENGIILDPFSQDEYYTTNRQGQRVLVHAQTRFIGALGQLISTGRCEDLIDGCAKAYEERLAHLDQVQYFPEFWIKELMYAHRALKDRMDPERVRRWEAIWRGHNPRASYGSVKGGIHHHNFVAFLLTAEFFKGSLKLGGDRELIEGAIEYLSRDFTPYGMYRDPNDPMTYDLVVKQQLDLVRHYGYDGGHLDWISERGALTSLLCQSVTGQMPFGGRSNQFHFVEGHFACLCETQAAYHRQAGDLLTAGIFKRAGRRAVQMCLPWIIDMNPFRHTKQGFHPSLGHGVDSAGPYSVYGALAASLFATAYHLADEEIEERITPAEVGGYVFNLWPAFHKVFATCGGYHVEIDTRADHKKDATGLGRIHREGVRPETALSASLSASAEYSFGVNRPSRDLAVGPAWKDAAGKEHRLADFEAEISDVTLKVLKETTDEVAFEVTYRGEMGGCGEIVESYSLTSEGLVYSVRLDPRPPKQSILVPVISFDGQEEASVSEGSSGVEVTYRGAAYRIRLEPEREWRFTGDPPAANRNALYRTLEVRGNEVWLELGPGGGAEVS